jgi:hypothetical protein
MAGFTFKTVEKDFGWAKILKAARALEKAKPYVKVGLLGGPKERRPGESIGNVELGVIHEFGAPSRGIPERSFIRAPFHAKKHEYLTFLRRLLKATLKGHGLEMKEALSLLGEKMAADFKKSAPGTPPPNAEATLQRKLAKTRPGSKGDPRTLVDTGRMVDSISYAVVMGGEKE